MGERPQSLQHYLGDQFICPRQDANQIDVALTQRIQLQLVADKLLVNDLTPKVSIIQVVIGGMLVVDIHQ
jgi:hypothetical protein